MKQLSTEQVQIVTSQCHRKHHVMHAIIFTIHRRLQEKIWVIHTDLAIDYLNMHAWFSFITDNARLTHNATGPSKKCCDSEFSVFEQ